MKICGKKGCNRIGDINSSHGTIYCFKCYRFNNMINQAQQTNKYIPNWHELEELFQNLHQMKCPICNKQMVWCTKLGRLGDVISLQHNNNGTIMLICQSCNVGHGHSHLGDKYFSLKENKKYCPKCNKVLYKNQFNKTKRNKDNCDYLCKQCKSKIYYRNKELGGQ